MQDPLVKMDTSMIFHRESEEIQHFPTFTQFATYLTQTSDTFDEHWQTYAEVGHLKTQQ